MENLFKKSIKWLGLLIVVHVVSMLIFGLAFSTMVAQMAEYEPIRAKLFVLIYNVIFDALFLAFWLNWETSYIDYRKSLREFIRKEKFSIVNYFKKTILKETLIKMCIFLAFQIPFAIFFAVLGMALQYPTMFDQFYIADAGFYLLTNSAILGIVLNTVLFSVIFTAITVVFTFKAKKEVEEDMVD